MNIAVFFIAIIAAVCALPKGEEDLHFRRQYVDPLIHPDELLPRIINGREVTPHSIPYQAFIIIDGPGTRWLCGGSLISARFVLTAANCLIGGVIATVYLGAHNVNLISEDKRVSITSNNLIPHESYVVSGAISNDIGLIGFSTPVELTDDINVVSLPELGDIDEYVGLLGRVSGWGLTASDADTSPVLLALTSTIISNRICDSYFGVVQEHQVCISGAQGGGTCNGDSGGPLTVGNLQVGIASYGAAGCLRGYPSAFTRTDYFLDWIEQHTDLKF